jgi:rhodanese-related sulfurtransferase
MTKTTEKKMETPKASGACTATDVKCVKMEDLKRMMEKHKPVQIVNVLAPEHYGLGMIKGSIKMPLAEMDKRFTELDKAKDVVTYCADSSCDASKKAAKLLAEKGFTVSAYEGGAKEWKAAGLPLE